MKQIGGTAVALLVLAVSYSLCDAAPSHVRQLSLGELRDTRGGVQTNSISPPGPSNVRTDDNPRYTVNFTNLTSNDHVFGIFAGNTKVASMIAPANLTETWTTRTMWPISGTFTMNTQSSQVGTTTWYASGTGGNDTVWPNLAMMQVRFWNTTVGGVTTSVTDTQAVKILDRLAEVNYDWEISSAVDAIYGQCAHFQRYQFRYVGKSTTTLSNCPNPVPGLDGGAGFPYYGIAPTCVNEAFNDTTANGTNVADINIVILPSMGGRGFHLRGPTQSSPTWYWIAVAEEIFGNESAAVRTIAHEMGHWIIHPNVPNHSTGCSGTCDWANELMCENTMTNCGRKITTTQCGNAITSRPFYYVDHN